MEKNNTNFCFSSTRQVKKHYFDVPIRLAHHSEQVSLVRIKIAAGFSYKTICTLAWCNTTGTKHWFLGVKSTRQWLCGNSILLMNNEWNVSMYKRNARPNNNHFITYYLPVCYFLKNTTITCEYYIQYRYYNNKSQGFIV